MAAVRQRRSAACLYYVFCAWMMMATVLHVQYAADTPFLLKANSVWANLAGLAVSSIGALANGLGAHRLKLRVIDAAWCYGFYTYAHGSNCLTGSYPIDHLIIAAFLTFVTVFLELPLTVTTAGYLFITWPAFLVIEYTQNYTQRGGADVSELAQQAAECMTQQCAANLAVPSLVSPLPGSSGLAAFIPRAVLMTALTLVINVLAQVLMHAQGVLERQEERARQREAAATQTTAASKPTQPTQTDTNPSQTPTVQPHPPQPQLQGPSRIVTAVLAGDWDVLERWLDPWVDKRLEVECRFYRWLLARDHFKLMGQAVVLGVFTPIVLYTAIRAFMGLLYTSADSTPPEYMFSPSLVLLTGISCVVLARINVWSLLQSLSKHQKQTTEIEVRLKTLESSHAVLLEERKNLEAQLLRDYEPMSVIDVGTRADKLRSLLHNLIHGGDALPVDQLRDLHQALVKGSNLYHPVDLAAQLEASAVDDDVGANLASTLGAGSFMRQRPSLFMSHSRMDRQSPLSNQGTASPSRISVVSYNADMPRPDSMSNLSGDPFTANSSRAETEHGGYSQPHSFTRQPSRHASEFPPPVGVLESDDFGDLRGISSSHPGMRSVLEHLVCGEVPSADMLASSPGPTTGLMSRPDSMLVQDLMASRSIPFRIATSYAGTGDAGAVADHRASMPEVPHPRGGSYAFGSRSMPRPHPHPHSHSHLLARDSSIRLTPTQTVTEPMAEDSPPHVRPSITASQSRGRSNLWNLSMSRPGAEAAAREGSTSSTGSAVAAAAAVAREAAQTARSAVQERSRMNVARTVSSARLRHSTAGSPGAGAGSGPQLSGEHATVRLGGSFLYPQDAKQSAFATTQPSPPPGLPAALQPAEAAAEPAPPPAPAPAERAAPKRQSSSGSGGALAPGLLTRAFSRGRPSIDNAALSGSAGDKDGTQTQQDDGGATAVEGGGDLSLRRYLEMQRKQGGLLVEPAGGAGGAAGVRVASLSDRATTNTAALLARNKAPCTSSNLIAATATRMDQAVAPPAAAPAAASDAAVSEERSSAGSRGGGDAAESDTTSASFAGGAETAVTTPKQISGAPRSRARSLSGVTAPSWLALDPEHPLLDPVEEVLCQVDDWDLNVFALDQASQGHALSTLAFFLMTREGLVKEFDLDAWSLARFLNHIEGGYLDNPYHNKTHAAHVLHRLHVVLHRAGFLGGYADHLTLMGCYISAAIHDYEHLGITNDFLINTQDPLAILYNDKAPLENHHLAASWALIRQPGYNFLSHLSRAEFDKLRKLVIELVLGTDMKLHFSLLSQFNAVHEATAAKRAHQAANKQQGAAAAAAARAAPAGEEGSPVATTPATASKAQPAGARPAGPGSLTNIGSPELRSSLKKTAAAEGQGSPVAVSRSNSARVSFNVVSAVSASIGRGRRGSFCAQLPAQGEEDATHGEAPQRSAYSATTRDQRAALAEEEDAAGPASAPLPTRASAGAAAPPGASRKGSFLQTCESPAIAAAVTERADKVLKPLDENERVLSLQIALKCADICNLCDPLDTHLEWVAMLEEEFFRQGDMERQNGMTISPLFDRSKPGVSKSQVAFMDIVAVPLFTAFAAVFSGSEPLLQSLMSNYYYWVAEKNLRAATEAKEAAETAENQKATADVTTASSTAATTQNTPDSSVSAGAHASGSLVAAAAPSQQQEAQAAEPQKAPT